MKLLEVIVTSAEEARAAEDGGAGRVEVVSDLASGGLTPSLDVVEQVLASVSLPVRMMLRPRAGFEPASRAEREELGRAAEVVRHLPLNGVVLGFVRRGEVDHEALQELLTAVAPLPATFHRAIEMLSSPCSGVRDLKRYPQIDRVLFSGGSGSWSEKLQRLEEVQQAVAPAITLIAGGGITEEGFSLLARSEFIREFHSGRAAREADGRVSSRRVHDLVKLLGSAQ